MKKKIAVLFGGCSSEYEISLASATSVIENLNPDKYEVIMVGITPDGDFYLYDGPISDIIKDKWFTKEHTKSVTFTTNRSNPGLYCFETNELIKVDVVFPVLHGRNGEDGRLQGLLELTNIKYVGCDMLSSAICMDKYQAHVLASASGIKVPKSHLFTTNNSLDDLVTGTADLKYPLFVKPVNAGSSLGITKINSKDEFPEAMVAAFEYDTKLVVEESIDGFEVGCAIMGNDNLQIGEVDEVEIASGFLDYNEKYKDRTCEIHLPARLTEEEREEIKKVGLKIYQALGCCGYSRVDMFYTPDKEIVFNEVNTIPGCTSHSRFPKMLEASGISFSEVLDTVINLSLED